MFEDRILTLAGLAKFELPGHTIRICDGGQVIWGDETFRAADDEFGTIGEVSGFAEESGDQAAGARLTFLPKDGAAAATLSSASYQNSPIGFWLAKVDPSTGEVEGEPEFVADMALDTTEIEFGKDYRQVSIEMIPAAEKLFLVNEGNTLSPTFHKSVWPGETGLDEATGVSAPVAWGVASPPRGSSSGSRGNATAAGRAFLANVR